MVVLMISALLSISAMTLFSVTHLQTLIAGNNRRSAVAKHAAASGVHHLMSLSIPVPNMARALREQSVTQGLVLQQIQIPGSKSWYDVSISICCDRDGGLLASDTIFVISTGYVKKAGRDIAVHKIISTIKWVE
jgi:hypothetical protein